MPTKTNPPSLNQNVSGDNNIVIGGDVTGNVVVGDNNTVNQTIIQKIFNIFRSDSETLEQRSRRIMLGHVENFWVKGILEKSLYGAALLELGIKEDPDALQYPWRIKREATKETLPAGISMLQIFQEIGMGRSLLILGEPGSGKTTMLLELTRRLIASAREDVTEPIPVVFNLSSWTEKLTMEEWLARQLNTFYSIPKKVAPVWINGNKMLLLLDGLDEVKQESRGKCVDAVNKFREANGLTSVVMCSRSEEYSELEGKLAFDGAIEIQSLTPEQIDKYFERFGTELAGIRNALERDNVLREMAGTPLFLSIMTLAYRDVKFIGPKSSENLDVARTRLFDTYIAHMFARSQLSTKGKYKQQDVIQWLSWLAHNMILYNQVPYFLEHMQPSWLKRRKQLIRYEQIVPAAFFIFFALVGVVPIVAIVALSSPMLALWLALLLGPIFGFVSLFSSIDDDLLEIRTVDRLTWSWQGVRRNLVTLVIIGVMGTLVGILSIPSIWWAYTVVFALLVTLMGSGVEINQLIETTKPGQRISLSVRNTFLALLVLELLIGLPSGILSGREYGWFSGLVIGLSVPLLGFVFILKFGVLPVIKHYILRLLFTLNHLFPFRLIPFLDYCVDLIFLRRVGGGYIFVHRLLMEHFASMYTGDEKAR